MRNVYNFSAGPAVLPESVLQETADEMLDYKGSGMSVMEISHRSSLFQSIIDETEQDLRTLRKRVPISVNLPVCAMACRTDFACWEESQTLLKILSLPTTPHRAVLTEF